MLDTALFSMMFAAQSTVDVLSTWWVLSTVMTAILAQRCYVYLKNKFNYVVVTVGDAKIRIRMPRGPLEWSCIGVLFGALCFAYYKYKQCKKKCSEAKTDVAKKKLHKRWLKMKRYMIFAGLIPLQFIPGSPNDIGLIIKQLISSYRDAGYAIDMIDGAISLVTEVFDTEDEDVGSTPENVAKPTKVKKTVQFVDDSESESESESDSSDEEDQDDEKKHPECKECGFDTCIKTSSSSSSFEIDDHTECDSCDSQADFRCLRDNSDRCAKCEFVYKTMITPRKKFRFFWSEDSTQQNIIDKLVASGQTTRQGLGYVSKKSIHVWQRFDKSFRNFCDSLREYTRSAFEFVCCHKLEFAAFAIAGLALVIYTFLSRKPSPVFGPENRPPTSDVEGGKMKKKGGRAGKKHRSLKQKAFKHATTAGNRDNHDISGPKSSRDNAPGDYFGGRACDEVPKPTPQPSKKKKSKLKKAKSADQLRVGFAVCKAPILYVVRMKDNVGLVSEVCAYPVSDSLVIPRHGCAGAVSLEVCVKGVYYPLGDVAHICKSMADQLWFKVPTGCKVKFNKFKYRAPKVGEIASLHWLDNSSPVYSTGKVGSVSYLGTDNVIEVQDFDSSSKAGACGGIYIGQTDGCVLGFHGIGGVSNVKPQFYPISDSWISDVVKWTHGKAKYDFKKDTEYNKTYNQCINNKSSTTDLKE